MRLKCVQPGEWIHGGDLYFTALGDLGSLLMWRSQRVEGTRTANTGVASRETKQGCYRFALFELAQLEAKTMQR
ncbi:hypothetical protein BIU99_02315 [Plantibacter sp. MMLR14_011]|nr:hypothetical protein BIU99_02315 [Plantibacter sp. MMLR14_011]